MNRSEIACCTRARLTIQESPLSSAPFRFTRSPLSSRLPSFLPSFLSAFFFLPSTLDKFLFSIPLPPSPLVSSHATISRDLATAGSAAPLISSRFLRLLLRLLFILPSRTTKSALSCVRPRCVSMYLRTSRDIPSDIETQGREEEEERRKERKGFRFSRGSPPPPPPIIIIANITGEGVEGERGS